MRRVVLWILIGAVISCCLVFGFQAIARVNEDKYCLSKQFDGVAVPVESFVQPQYVKDNTAKTIVDVFNDFELHYKYGDDNFRMVNSAGQFIMVDDSLGDFWMTTKESEAFRERYGILIADCDCAAIDAASRFIAAGFPAKVVIGTVSLCSDDGLIIGTFQHAWVKVQDPATKVWYLADMVIEKTLTALKPYNQATTYYHTYWEFNNKSHYWGATAAFLLKYPEITSDELRAVREMYLGG